MARDGRGEGARRAATHDRSLGQEFGSELRATPRIYRRAEHELGPCERAGGVLINPACPCQVGKAHSAEIAGRKIADLDGEVGPCLGVNASGTGWAAFKPKSTATRKLRVVDHLEYQGAVRPVASDAEGRWDVDQPDPEKVADVSGPQSPWVRELPTDRVIDGAPQQDYAGREVDCG